MIKSTADEQTIRYFNAQLDGGTSAYCRVCKSPFISIPSRKHTCNPLYVIKDGLNTVQARGLSRKDAVRTWVQGWEKNRKAELFLMPNGLEFRVRIKGAPKDTAEFVRIHAFLSIDTKDGT